MVSSAFKMALSRLSNTQREATNISGILVNFIGSGRVFNKIDPFPGA
jgi:hypothetical protein